MATTYWRLAFPAALSALLALGGCSSSESGSEENDGGTEGGSEGGSGAQGNLEDGVAGTACESADDCAGEGARCIDSFQLTGSLATLGAIAGLDQAAPGNYCTATCTSDDQCGEGGICSGAFLDFDGQCEQACDSDDDCRDGYICTSFTVELEDIDPETLAEAGVGDALPDGGIPQQPLTCRPDQERAALDDDVAGSACTENADCGGDGAECRTEVGGIAGLGATEAPGGYCSGDCTEDSDCGAGGVCVGAFEPLFSGSCLKSCETNADCERDGYLCRSLTGPPSCRPATIMEDGEAGSECSDDADCGENGSCADSAAGSSEALTGGFCTLPNCLDDADCGAGGACQVTVDSNGVPSSRCAEGCDVAAQDCSRADFACVTQDDASAALEGAPLSPYCQLQAPAAP